MQPFLLGCDSRLPKVMQSSLTAIQRLITFRAVSEAAAEQLITCLWGLMESSVEELRLLQTITLLVSTSNVVHGRQLARALSLCFRLNFTKDVQTNNAASATVRQLCSVIFDRVLAEDQLQALNTAHIASMDAQMVEVKLDDLKNSICLQAPRSLRLAAADAFMLFQDLLQLINAEQPQWLTGLTEMTRTFGLELLESAFASYSEVFIRHDEFSFLLKERVCPLIIKLLSPNIKYKHSQLISNLAQSQPNLTSASLNVNPTNQLNSSGTPSLTEKPFFPLTQRLLRIVGAIVCKFNQLLVTECEIFLSLLLKLLEVDKPQWQRCLALEVLHRMTTQPKLIRAFCLYYDMKSNSSKILRDLCNSLGIYSQSLFISPAITPSLLSSIISAASAAANANILSTSVSGSSTGSSSLSPGANINLPTNVSNSNAASNALNNANSASNNPITSVQPAFYFKNQWLPIAYPFQLRSSKCVYLEQLDKQEQPSIPDGYGLTIVYYSIVELVVSLLEIFDEDYEKLKLNQAMGRVSSTAERAKSPIRPISSKISDVELEERVRLMPLLEDQTRSLHTELLSCSWTGIYAVLSLLLDGSTDEAVTEQILNLLEKLIGFYGLYDLKLAQQAMISVLCRASLPIGYTLPQLAFRIPSTIAESPITNASSETTNVPTHSRSSSIDSTASGFITQLSNNAFVLQQSVTSASLSSAVGNSATTTNPNQSTNSSLGASQTSIGALNSVPSYIPSDSFDIRQQVVAVGTALPYPALQNSAASSVSSSSSGVNSTSASNSVLLTAKNLQCMKQLLHVAHAHGRTLGDCWYSVLLSLQHLVWILGLKPGSNGALKSIKASASESAISNAALNAGAPQSSASIVTTAAMADLPMLSTMLTRLFDSSQ